MIRRQIMPGQQPGVVLPIARPFRGKEMRGVGFSLGGPELISLVNQIFAEDDASGENAGKSLGKR